MRLRSAVMVVTVLALMVGVSAALAGGAPSIAFTPGSHDFGTVAKDTTASQTFVLKNTGGSATGALTVSLSGSSAFSTTADTCSATSLGPKKQCSVTVQYAPTTDGSADTGTLKVQGKKSSGLATASLTGASTPADPFAVSRADCEAVGGTLSTDPASDHLHQPLTFIWSCNNMPTQAASVGMLLDCQGNGGNEMDFTVIAPFDSTCYKNDDDD